MPTARRIHVDPPTEHKAYLHRVPGAAAITELLGSPKVVAGRRSR